MILVIDIGNSFIKWKCSDENALCVDRGRFAHAANLNEQLSPLLVHAIEYVAVSNVANLAIEDDIQMLFPKARFVSVKSTLECLGVVSGYQQPERLGVDRWLAMIEAYYLADKKAVCVLDLGTAATLDVVDATGRHLGGYIVPGMSMMRDALHQSTSRVRVSEQGGVLAYGINTNQAVENGLLAMMVAWIEREVHEFNRQHPDGEIYLTGGDASLLAAVLSVNGINVCEELVLDGLRRIATR